MKLSSPTKVNFVAPPSMDTLLKAYTKFTFVGLDNFIYMFTVDAEFLPNLADSLLKMFYQVPVIVIFSLLIAMVLRGKYVGHTFFRAMFFFPVVIASGVVITILQTQVMMTGSATTAQQQAYIALRVAENPRFIPFLQQCFDTPRNVACFSAGSFPCIPGISGIGQHQLYASFRRSASQQCFLPGIRQLSQMFTH